MATENLETNPYGPHSPSQSRATRPSHYEDGLGTKQTALVLIIVVGCFAVLWPNLLYPLLFSSSSKPGTSDSGCCDVISELDVDTIKIMSELCSTIIDDSGQTPKEIVSQCRKAVLETCGIDISAALQDRISLGQSVKQILEEVRSLNGSLCLKYNFGVSPWKLGVPHRVNINLDPANIIRQERPPNMHPGMVHPAFKERGRAIPQTDDSAARKRSKPPPRVVEGRPGPIPGMRAAMAGHQVAAPKQSTYGFMGVVMPMYTIGFVVFFSYTIMKLLLTKKPDDYVGSPLYPPCDTDEQFNKEVFEANKHYFNRPNKDGSKIVVNAVAALLEEVNQEIEAHKNKTPPDSSNEQDEIRANGSLPKEEEQGSVTVMGMETTASSESGKKWSRPDSPVLPHPHPAPPKEPSPPPQQIFLEGALPPQSQILVADSATETQKDFEDDSPVVLAGKMTLSVISVDSEPGTEYSSNSGKKTGSSDEDRRRSSSNISEEFEKIDAADLEDQINHIIEEAAQVASAEETRLNLNEELDKLPDALSEFENDVVVAEENRSSLREELEEGPVELPQAPNINEKEFEQDILEEIKNQFNLEDDLMRVLKEQEPEGKVSMPVTDIIKEFLNNEENILQTVDETEAQTGEEDIAPDMAKEEQQSAENLQISKENQDLEEPDTLKSSEAPREEVIEPLVAEEQIGLPQKEAAEEDLYTTEQFLQSEASVSDSIQPKELQEIGLDDEDLEVTEDTISAAKHSRSTEQFLKSETSIQPKEQQEIDLVESEHIQELQTKPTSAEETDEPIKSHEDIQKTDTNPEEEDKTEPEEKTPTNKADLLLQGLMVKDTVTDTPGASASTKQSTPETDVRDDTTPELKEEIGPDVLDIAEQEIEDIEYQDESEDDLDEDELRGDEGIDYEDRESAERRLNGEEGDSSRNGAGNSETAAENEISEDELENEDDEEIEEIIEYVDDTDEEGEEIIEINGNEHRHLNGNGAR